MPNTEPVHFKLTSDEGKFLRSELYRADIPYVVIEDENGIIGIVVTRGYYNLSVHARDIVENAKTLEIQSSADKYMTYEEVFD